MKEHQSSDWLFAGTINQLPSMSKFELSEIVRIAEQSVNGYLTFSPEATERIAELAQGHPYMVHLIGKYAFRAAYQSHANTIAAASIDETLRSIAERGADPVLEGLGIKRQSHLRSSGRLCSKH